MGQFWKNIDTQPHSVPIGNGNVVAARPGDVFEVESETPTLLRLKRQNHVVRSGRPSNPLQVVKPVPVHAEVPRKRANTEFAQRTMERGTVRGVDEAKRVAEQAAKSRIPEAEAELARRAAIKQAEQASESEKPEAVVEVAEAADPVETEAVEVETQVNDGTAEGTTMSKKAKRRWARANE